ncbi:unnamed protein product [Soboliphyme baturini]|uniref:Pecanex-like protein n=1 Tax=Soboliphyme baturini TaxID=241478 RepID=A0A183J4Y9_9BILA|nr:unnamed protein product [Soboliphyme baturini]
MCFRPCCSTLFMNFSSEAVLTLAKMNVSFSGESVIQGIWQDVLLSWSTQVVFLLRVVREAGSVSWLNVISLMPGSQSYEDPSDKAELEMEQEDGALQKAD